MSVHFPSNAAQPQGSVPNRLVPEHPSLPKYTPSSPDSSSVKELEHAASASPNAVMHQSLAENAKKLSSKQKASAAFLQKCGKIAAFAAGVPCVAAAKVIAFSSCLATGGVAGLYVPAQPALKLGERILQRDKKSLERKKKNFEVAIDDLKEQNKSLDREIEDLKARINADPSQYLNPEALLKTKESQKNYLEYRIETNERDLASIKKALKKKKEKPEISLKDRINRLHHSGLKTVAPFNRLSSKLIEYSMPKHQEKVKNLDRRIENAFAKAGTAIGVGSGAAASGGVTAIGITAAGVVSLAVLLLMGLGDEV